MFKIKIQEVKEVTFNNTTDYQRVADSGNERDDGAVYEYVPHPDTKTVETTMLEQNVDAIDLCAVIKAINGID